MSALAFLAGIYFIFNGLRGKGRAFTSKMGTPLSGREAKAVKYIYLTAGALLIIAGIVSTIQLFA